jgi:hypothetical protein
MLLAVFISTFTFGQTTPSDKSKKLDLEILLANDVSKLIYLNNDCAMPITIEKEQFRDIAKVRAISEGIFSLDDIDWTNIKREGHKKYGMLKIEAPMGEYCKKYSDTIGGNYKFIK